MDVPGVAMLIAGVGSMAFGVVQTEALGWRSPAVLITLVAGATVLAAFVRWARRVPHPVVDLSLFDDRTYRHLNAAMLAFGAAFSMMFFGFFFFTMQVWHYPLPLAGLAVTPGPLLVVPVAIVSGRLAARIGHRPLLVGQPGLRRGRTLVLPARRP